MNRIPEGERLCTALYDKTMRKMSDCFLKVGRPIHTSKTMGTGVKGQSGRLITRPGVLQFYRLSLILPLAVTHTGKSSILSCPQGVLGGVGMF